MLVIYQESLHDARSTKCKISCPFALLFSNVILQLVTLFLIIHEVLGSNIGDDTG